jgi:hypothetical protein
MKRNKIKLRKKIRDNLETTVTAINSALAGGESLHELATSLKRLGRGKQLSHWYQKLADEGTLPNLDGKSLGSVIEMLFVAVLERLILKGDNIGELRINPAKGIDIPDLDLGIKSPSENYCTSEPFFSAYERILGNEHDAIILLTDYQTAKKNPPLKLQINDWCYLAGSEIADANLCNVAKINRNWMLDEHEPELKKVIRFICYINQGDWEARQLLKLVSNLGLEDQCKKIFPMIQADFEKANAKSKKEERELIPVSILKEIIAIKDINPMWFGIVNKADNWVIQTHRDFGRYPNENEWTRFIDSPLNGRIGMSFALQWRYNFGSLFRKR